MLGAESVNLAGSKDARLIDLKTIYSSIQPTMVQQFKAGRQVGISLITVWKGVPKHDSRNRILIIGNCIYSQNVPLYLDGEDDLWKEELKQGLLSRKALTH